MADFQLYLQMKFSQKSAQIFDLNGRFFLLSDFYTNCASFGRFGKIKVSKNQKFLKTFLKIKNDFDFAKKLSHKNAIKGHIFGDADFADF